jgi:hypothetical protein
MQLSILDSDVMCIFFRMSAQNKQQSLQTEKHVGKQLHLVGQKEHVKSLLVKRLAASKRSTKEAMVLA